MEFDALFHIDDSFKLRMGSGYINTDMWVERLNIVHAAIYPLSILYMEGVNFEKNRD